MKDRRYRKKWRTMTIEMFPASEINDWFVYEENIFWSECFWESGKPSGMYEKWKINVTIETF